MHVDAQAGEKWNAWVAGPAVGVETHYCSRTVPCLRKYLGKKIECEGCSKPVPLDFSYYLPLYRCIDSRPVVVILHRDQQDTLETLKHHQHVVVGRTKEKYVGLYVSPILAAQKFQTTLDWKMGEAKIEEFLPTLWKMRGVISAEMILRGPLLEDKLPLLGDEPERKKLLPAAEVELGAAVVGQNFVVAGENGPRPLEGDVAEVYKRLKSRAKPEKNGTH